MLVKSRQPLERCLDVLRRDVADRLRLEDPHQPPVRVAIVQQEELVPLDDARLPVDGREEGVERVDEAKVDVLVRDRRGGGQRVGEGARVVLVVLHMLVLVMIPCLPVPHPEAFCDLVSRRTRRLVLHHRMRLCL